MSTANIAECASIESIEQNNTKQSDVPLTYRVATLLDCESLSLLVNSSYRGESSCQGWTTEDSLVGGPRIDVQMLADIINDNTNIILVFFDLTDKILVGCTHLQLKSAIKAAYLGMLTVRPNLQAKEYGKFIMSVAENYAVNNWNVEYMEMTVIIFREELIAYYKRRGYVDTGRREPFPIDYIKFVIPKKANLEFCVLKKYVKKD
jgi:ribosomal protein S18 acetylase RimI-like enzyme